MKESEGWTEEFLRQYALASAEAVAAGQRAPMLDDCTISGNHGMWAEASNGFRADFLLALGVSEGIKLDLKFLQQLTLSVAPTGIPNVAAFEAVANDMDTEKSKDVMDETKETKEWCKGCEILSKVIKLCDAQGKIVVFEMTINPSLPHHKFFTDFMASRYGVNVFDYWFQGGSAYAHAFHVTEWMEMLLTNPEKLGTTSLLLAPAGICVGVMTCFQWWKKSLSSISEKRKRRTRKLASTTTEMCWKRVKRKTRLTKRSAFLSSMRRRN